MNESYPMYFIMISKFDRSSKISPSSFSDCRRVT